MAETSSRPKVKAPVKKQIDFIVTTANPNDASSAKANKKRVRSVAALKSWPERRKKMFQQLEDAGTGHGAFSMEEATPEPSRRNSQQLTTTVSKPWPERRTKAFRERPEISSSTSSSSDVKFLVEKPEQQAQWRQPQTPAPCPMYMMESRFIAPRIPPGFTNFSPQFQPQPFGIPIPDRTTPPRDRQDSGSSFVLDGPGSSMVLYRSKAAEVSPPPQVNAPEHHDSTVSCSCVHCFPQTAPSGKKRMADGSDKRMVQDGVVLLTPPCSPNRDAARGRADPFNCYTVDWQPWFDQILHHMMSVYAPRGWPALGITQSQGMQWEWFLTQNALAEPALFYVRLLFGSGDLIRLGGMRKEIMFWLREQAIKAINEALGDPRRACSDALILAVGRIAMHEHMYGDRVASVAVHRPAQRKMIEMRGGMSRLGFPELVKRLMRWSDEVMAVGTKTERMLDDDVREPNFTLRESVHAIEKWAPHEMPRVRTHVKLSDLLNDEDES